MAEKTLKADTALKKESLLANEKPSKAIVRLAVPATLALLAKAVYNIVDTAYIGLLNSEAALAAVGVTLPLLLIFVSIENIFASGAAVLAGRHLGAGNKNGANTIVSTIALFSFVLGIALCVLGLIFMEPLLRFFGAKDSFMPLAKDYAFWMFIAAIANVPAQNLNAAARAESSVKITSIAIISGAILNVILDPIFMFSFGFNMGVSGASLATMISQFVTFGILIWFYAGGRSIIKIRPSCVKPSVRLFKDISAIGIPSALIQICLALATSLTNMAAAALPNADMLIAAYGIVQRLVLIASYVIMGLMQGYQPIAAYAFGAKNEERFHAALRFALKASIALSMLMAALYIIPSKHLIMLFNRNPLLVQYGSMLLISQTALFPVFGICYMMTITFQTIGAVRYGLFLSTVRQGIFYSACILILPPLLGLSGLYAAQPAADILTLVLCLISIRPMKRIASHTMLKQ